MCCERPGSTLPGWSTTSGRAAWSASPCSVALGAALALLLVSALTGTVAAARVAVAVLTVPVAGAAGLLLRLG